MGDERADRPGPAESDFGKGPPLEPGGGSLKASDLADSLSVKASDLGLAKMRESLDVQMSSLRGLLEQSRIPFKFPEGFKLDAPPLRERRRVAMRDIGESVDRLGAIMLAAGELAKVHIGIAEQSDRRLAELIEALRAGQAAQDRASRWLLVATIALVALTIVLAIPLVLDGLDWMGLIAR